MKQYIEFIINEIKLIFIWIMEQVLSAFVALLNAIPVPGFLENISSFQLPQGVLYYTTLFQLTAGITIIVSAYTLRFIIRRLPFVG